MKPAPPVTIARMAANPTSSVDRASVAASRAGSSSRARGASARSPASGRRRARAIARRERLRVAGRREPVGRDELGQRADVRGRDGKPGGHRLGGGRGRRSRRCSDGISASRAPARSSASAVSPTLPGEASRRRRPRSARAREPSPATTSGIPRDPAGLDRHAEPLLRLEPRAEQRVAAGVRPRALRERRAPGARGRGSAGSGAPSSRRRVARELARDDRRVDQPGQPALPERERGGVDERLGQRRRGSCAARPAACCARGSACTRAPAVKQIPTAQTSRYWCRCATTRAPALARRGQRAPAERGVEVVGVHDPRAGAADGVRDLVGPQAAAQHRRPRRGARPSSAESRSSSSTSSPRCSRTSQQRGRRRRAPRRRCGGSGCAGTGPCWQQT